MPIPIKPIIEALKPYAKQAAEYAATYVIEEGVKKIFEKKEKKKNNKQKK
jgi:hypothetical protein